MVMLKDDLKIPYFETGIAFELIQSMLMVDPKIRPTVMDVLNSSFFILPVIKEFFTVY